MKKFISLLLAALLCYIGSDAQWMPGARIRKELETSNVDTVAWIHNFTTNIGFNEGLHHNWSAGGEVASMTINSALNGFISHIRHQHIWTNSVSLAYSLNYAYSNNFVPRKTDDRIDFTSKYSFRLDTSSNFYFASVLNFKSQFSPGYDYTLPNWDSASTSKFMSPGYFILSIGGEYRKGSNVSFYFSPFAGRLIVADRIYTSRSKDGAFGIDSGKMARFEFGAYFSGIYKLRITKNMSFRTRLDLYSNYLAKDKKDGEGTVVSHDSPLNINVYSENVFDIRFARFLSLNVSATFIYDNNLPYSKTYIDVNGVEQLKDEPGMELGWLQLRHVISLGFEYKF